MKSKWQQYEITVAEVNRIGKQLNQLSSPYGIYIDDDNQCIYIKEDKIIVGGNGKGEQLNQFNLLRGLSFDRQGNLYVVDNSNNRVQKFNIDLS